MKIKASRILRSSILTIVFSLLGSSCMGPVELLGPLDPDISFERFEYLVQYNVSDCERPLDSIQRATLTQIGGGSVLLEISIIQLTTPPLCDSDFSLDDPSSPSCFASVPEVARLLTNEEVSRASEVLGALMTPEEAGEPAEGGSDCNVQCFKFTYRLDDTLYNTIPGCGPNFPEPYLSQSSAAAVATLLDSLR